MPALVSRKAEREVVKAGGLNPKATRQIALFHRQIAPLPLQAAEFRPTKTLADSEKVPVF